MRLLCVVFLLLSFSGYAQPITVMDFVQVKEEHRAEAFYYYEHNWKLFRDIALKKGFIVSYRLEETVADAAGEFNLILITEYKDSVFFQNSEANISGIINMVRPGGPALLNSLQPDEFRKKLFLKYTRNRFRSYTAGTYTENPGHLE